MHPHLEMLYELSGFNLEINIYAFLADKNFLNFFIDIGKNEFKRTTGRYI